MKKITTIILAVMCAAVTCAQDSYKEKTVFKNDDVEIRQIDERTRHGNGHILMQNRNIPVLEKIYGMKQLSDADIDELERVPGRPCPTEPTPHLSQKVVAF